MAFSWGGGGDEGESPASSSTSGDGGGNNAGRGFWLGGGGNSDRSEDESDSGAYGLFNNDFTGYPSTSTSDGLSLDFWSIDDIKPMNLVGGGSNNSSSGGQGGATTAAGAATGAGEQYNDLFEDPLLKARKEILLGSSPDAAMETFDDLAGFGSAGPTPTNATSNNPPSAFAASNTASNVFGLYSDSGSTPGNMQVLDPGSLFGGAPSSVFTSPSTSNNNDGINMQDLLGVQPQSSTSAFTGFNSQNMIGQQQQQYYQQLQHQQQQQGQASGPSSLISPQTLFQQLSFSSGASNPTNSSSSRDSSSDPPGGSGAFSFARRQSSSASTTGDSTSYGQSSAQSHPTISPQSAGQTSSSASTTRIGTAANSPPSQQNTTGLRQSKSGSSLASQVEHHQQQHMKEKSTTSHKMPASQSHNGSTMLSMPDKALQQQAAETTGVVKHVIRDNTLRAPDGSSLCQLLVLGLPDEGARSRVETQVKIGLILLRPKAQAQLANQAPVPTAMNYKDPKGALTAEANQYFDKVGNWRYIALPAVSSVKRRARKHYKEGISPEETLYADIKVVSASVPSREIAICQNCQQREVKRQQRKTQNRSKPSGDIDSGREDEEGLSEDELAKRKIVLFNCGQYLDFTSGETVIPTRITCYCRHHKEKYGFNITYTLTDHLGNVVATAMSPPIFLTDDHKAKPTRPEDVDLGHIPSLARVANGPLGGLSQRSSAWNSAASSMPSSAASSQASSVTSSAAPSRSNSVENLDELHQNATSHSTKARKDRSAKPYNLESRPSKPKRTNSLNRLNSFAMTPMNLSAPGSPRLSGLSPLTTNTQLPPEYLAMSSASLQSYGDMLQSSTAEANNLNSLPHDHQSPHSSVSAPSTPGAGSLDSFSASLQSQAGLNFPAASGSVTSTSDEQASSSSRSVEQSPMYPHMAPLPLLQQSSLSQHLASLNMANANALNQQPRPRISRIIPNEGPTHGGTEVIILGDNFTTGLEVTFGETPAVSAQAWGGNTLVCILPPSPSPGPVVVAFKGLPLAVNDNTGLQLFTYVDTSDKALMELALQVVGMKMSGGRIEDARNVARRIIGAGGAGAGFSQSTPMGQQGNSGFTQASAGADASQTPGQFLAMSAGSGTRDFQAMIIKLLSMLDVDYSDSSPDLPSNPLDHLTEHKHTLLHLAAMLGFHRLVSWLIERDAALNMQDKHGYTPLHLAALSGRVTITRLLLQAGAIHDTKNQAGQTPVDIARVREQIDVEALFTRHTPSRSASSASLAVSPERELAERFVTSPRLSAQRKTFSLPSEISSAENSDSDSDWSGDEDDDEAHFASESELESHISRLSRVHSAASLTRELPTVDQDGADSGVDVRSVGTPPHSNDVDRDDDAYSDSASSAWLPKLPSARLLSKFSKLKLPTPPSIASWRGIASAAMSNSPSAASLSLSSHISTPTTVPDSEAVSSVWPSTLLQAAQASASIPLKDGNVLGMRASLSRALGYSIDHITEDALRSYSYHAQKYGSTFRRDKMLYFFWLPLFLIAMIWVYCQASAFVMSTLGILKEAVVVKVPVLAIL